MIKISINDQTLEVDRDKSILQSALDEGIYIPHLCYHPQLDSFSELRSLDEVYRGGSVYGGEGGVEYDGCNLCLVRIDGREGFVKACKTLAEDGMSVSTGSEELREARAENLVRILETHPHDCLLCSQAEGCDRKLCSIQIPENERCCFKFGICELQKVAEFVGLHKGLPPYVPLNIPVDDDEPLIKRDYNLCIGCLRCVRVCKEVKGADALGFTVRDGKVVVGWKGPTLKESGCQFCGYCVEVCQTGALADKDVGSGGRERYLIPCVSSCPAGIDIPRYIRSIRNEEFEKTLRVIREKVPFPATLGHVCFHPCEAVCRRGSVDDPVAICALKRIATELGEVSYSIPAIRKKTGEKVAVIGSGPAGLTAAHYLNGLGHCVTVFEESNEPGGMLRLGIPAFRLPRSVLNREIKAIEDAGVEIKLNCRVESMDKLASNGFHAIFVATGAHKVFRLGIEGEDNEGVIDGVTFLRDVNLSRSVVIGERVAVIGGGNVAIDSARSALRLGAKEVTIYYRRTRKEMPAYDEEVDSALEEGVKIEYQVSPIRFERVNEVLNVEFIQMKMGDLDDRDRRSAVPIEGSEYKLPLDTIITAVGQGTEILEGIDISANSLHIRPTMQPDAARGIFIGGDLLTGPKTVVDAIASGRKGAVLMDRFLGGEGNIDQAFIEQKQALLGLATTGIGSHRAPAPMLPAKQRISDFSVVSLGLDEPAAIGEANRCLGCDLRFEIKSPVLPPERWLILSKEVIEDVPDTEGVYILYDENKKIYKICGVENIRQALLDECGAADVAQYFTYEEDPMFTGKERQLTQQYMKQYSKMPPGNAELDDLF